MLDLVRNPEDRVSLDDEVQYFIDKELRQMVRT